MRILFIADSRSPIAQNWIDYFIQRGHEVHLISSFACESSRFQGASYTEAPIAYGGLSRNRPAGTNAGQLRPSPLSHVTAEFRSGRLAGIGAVVFNWLAVLGAYRQAGYVARLIDDIQPDLVHALRIPFEGILAALAVKRAPLLISVWGNDLTLQAEHYPLIGALTRRALRRADALHCDCVRDMLLSSSWGFDDSKPSIVLPGAGGVQRSVFYARSDHTQPGSSEVPSNVRIVINPRGFRGYVRNDVFFKAAKIVLQQLDGVVFLCSAMENEGSAKQLVHQLGISSSVRLLPYVPRDQMADHFRSAEVVVSPSNHDGTPNTLLEAMACGCFPVAGDIESVREWITHGVNGLLCDPNDPAALAKSILRALEDAGLRNRAREQNLKAIRERADYLSVMAQAEPFYERVIEHALSLRKAGTRIAQAKPDRSISESS